MVFNSTFGGHGNATSISANDTFPAGPSATNGTLFPGIDMVAYFSSHVQSKQVSLSLLVWVVYDHILTLSDSVNLFWLCRWSISKGLFLTSRYVTIVTATLVTVENFVSNPSDTFCRVSPWLRLTGATILISIINLILVSRIYALWNRSRLILILTMLGLVLNAAVFFGIVAYTYIDAEIMANHPPFTGCMALPHFHFGWTMLVATLTYEAILVTLTAIKAYPVAIQRGVKTPLYTLLLHDGLLYFLVIMILQIINLISIFQPGPLTGVMVNAFPALAVIGVSCSRLLLRLQRALVGTKDEPYSDFIKTELERDWPIVTFGGSGVKAEPDAGGSSTQHSHFHLPALPYATRISRRSRRQHPRESTVAKPEEDVAARRSALAELELDLAPLDEAHDDMFSPNEGRIVGGKGDESTEGAHQSSSLTGHGARRQSKRLQKRRSSTLTNHERAASTLAHGMDISLTDLSSSAMSKKRKESIARSPAGQDVHGHHSSSMAMEDSGDRAGRTGWRGAEDDFDPTESRSRISGSLDREIDIGGAFRALTGAASPVGSRTGAPIGKEADLEGDAVMSTTTREARRDESRNRSAHEQEDVEETVAWSRGRPTTPIIPVVARIEQEQIITYHPRPRSSGKQDDEPDRQDIPMTGTSISGSFPFSYANGRSVLDSSPPASLETDARSGQGSASGHSGDAARPKQGSLRISRVGIYD